MFTTPEKVLDYTGYEVTNEEIWRAQIVIEAFVGRTEDEITESRDIRVMERATVFQAAYMSKNYNMVYEEIWLSRIRGTDFDWSLMNDSAPFLAPMAAHALRNLSWKRSRSVHIGPNPVTKGSQSVWESD